jgi:cysteine desulfuration protein SufE
MSINEKAQSVVEEFAIFDDWMDKYSYIIELGQELQILDESKKENSHLISGCQSRVWLDAELVDGEVIYTADSDAVITKGIVSLLIRVLSGSKPSEIVDADLSFLDKIGLNAHLSPTRANGLVSMIKQMKLYAKAFQLKQDNQ